MRTQMKLFDTAKRNKGSHGVCDAMGATIDGRAGRHNSATTATNPNKKRKRRKACYHWGTRCSNDGDNDEAHTTPETAAQRADVDARWRRLIRSRKTAMLHQKLSRSMPKMNKKMPILGQTKYPQKIKTLKYPKKSSKIAKNIY